MSKTVQSLQKYTPLIPYAVGGTLIAGIGLAGYYLYTKLQALKPELPEVPEFLKEILPETTTGEPLGTQAVKLKEIIAELERAYKISKAQMDMDAFERAVALVPSYGLAPLDQAYINLKISNWRKELEKDFAEKEARIAEEYSQYSLLLDEERRRHEQEMRDLQTQIQLLQVQASNTLENTALQNQITQLQEQLAIATFAGTGELPYIPGFEYPGVTAPTSPEEPLPPTTTEQLPVVYHIEEPEPFIEPTPSGPILVEPKEELELEPTTTELIMQQGGTFGGITL